MATNRPPQQPQQAGQQGPRQRILRIGVLLGGKLVEERLIRERTPVSIGQSMKNTFSIPIEGLPLEFTLFALDENRYSLRFLGKMDGRLSDSSGQVNTLDALKTKGAANHGDYWQAPVTDSARGKLSMGDLTILFQFVTEPPRQPKPMLPASVRGTFADRFDPQLSVIMGASIIAHFAIVIIALIGDVEKPKSIINEAYEATFEAPDYALAQKKEPAVAEAGSAAGSAAKVETPKVPEPSKVVPKGPSSPPEGRKEDTKPTMSNDAATKLAEIMTGGESATGTNPGDVSKRAPSGDLKAQIKDVVNSGGKVAIGDGTGGKNRGGGQSNVGTSSGTKIDAPGGIAQAGGGKTEEKGPSGRISVSSKTSTGDDTTLSADAVLARITGAYMSAIQRCYKTHLAKDASARGKVTLSLTVNASGRLTERSADGFPADDVNQCITGIMANWFFPPPKDKSDPTNKDVQASFRIALQLVPE